MAATTVGSALSATYSDGKTQSYAPAYQPFFVTRNVKGDSMYGLPPSPIAVPTLTRTRPPAP